jgi:hypothetical protein
VDPVPDPLLLRKSGSAGNRTRTSRTVTNNSDHKTTEAVKLKLQVSKFTEKPTVAHSVNKFLSFGGMFMCSQRPTTETYSDPE